MRTLIVIIFITLGILAHAEPLVHTGVSAGLNGAFYTLCTGAMNRQADLRPGCLITSSALTGMIAIISEVNDAGPTNNIDGKDLAMDAIGIGASSLVIYLLDIRGKKDGPQVGFNGQNVTIGWRW